MVGKCALIKKENENPDTRNKSFYLEMLHYFACRNMHELLQNLHGIRSQINSNTLHKYWKAVSENGRGGVHGVETMPNAGQNESKMNPKCTQDPKLDAA